MIREPSSYTFTEEEQAKISEEIKKSESELTNIDVNLRSDRIRVPHQNFALISVVYNETRQKCDRLCLKLKGVFDTMEQAEEHVKQVMMEDPNFDVYVVSMYEWLLLPPKLEDLSNVQYIDEELNTLISEYRKNQELSKMEFDCRRDGLKSNPDVNALANALETNVSSSTV